MYKNVFIDTIMPYKFYANRTSLLPKVEVLYSALCIFIAAKRKRCPYT